MTDEQLKIALQHYVDNIATPEEMEMLLRCFGEDKHKMLLKNFIDQNWDNPFLMEMLNENESGALYDSIKAEIVSDKGRVVKFWNWNRLLVAASAVLVVSIGIWLLAYRPFGRNKELVESAAGQREKLISDIAPPSSSKAILFLDDGTKISLNSDSNKLKKFTESKYVSISQGQLIYQKSDRPGSQQKIVYNTLYNPKGSHQVLVTLPDETKVWLNSESSIKYPVSFAGNERRVEINGEAYFEVAHDKKRPFLVANRKTMIQVLGTHFNVNTYCDKEKVIVTLLEGSVKISNGSETNMLKPGQQAQVDNDIKVLSKADTAKVMAWKNEVFNFTQADIAEIMKQLERWYDVEVEYEEDLPSISLSGVIDRNINASRVIEMLQMSSGLDFRISGRKIMVRKKIK